MCVIIVSILFQLAEFVISLYMKYLVGMKVLRYLFNKFYQGLYKQSVINDIGHRNNNVVCIVSVCMCISVCIY